MSSTTAKAILSADRIEETEAPAVASEFVGIALFSGLGLLLSLAVVILDQLLLSDWF